MGYVKKDKNHFIVSKHVIIKNNDIIIKEDGDRFLGTSGLWELITSKKPNKFNYDKADHNSYVRLMIKTDALHHNNDPNNPQPKSSKSEKWNNLLRYIWAYKINYEGKGIVIMPSDPNALLERLDLLLASQEAGPTGVRNELVSICDELKRQGVLDTVTYKKLNSIIKK